MTAQDSSQGGDAGQKVREDIWSIPFSCEFNLWIILISLLVDVNLLSFSFLPVGTSVSEFDVDLLTSIFPSDARSARRSDYALYLCGLSSGGLSGSVTPVRRREDTDGNGDAGVKVQIAGLYGRLALEFLSGLKGRREKTEGFESSGGKKGRFGRSLGGSWLTAALWVYVQIRGRSSRSEQTS